MRGKSFLLHVWACAMIALAGFVLINDLLGQVPPDCNGETPGPSVGCASSSLKCPGSGTCKDYQCETVLVLAQPCTTKDASPNELCQNQNPVCTKFWWCETDSETSTCVCGSQPVIVNGKQKVSTATSGVTISPCNVRPG
jgi:hypothetical protein